MLTVGLMTTKVKLSNIERSENMFPLTIEIFVYGLLCCGWGYFVGKGYLDKLIVKLLSKGDKNDARA